MLLRASGSRMLPRIASPEHSISIRLIFIARSLIKILYDENLVIPENLSLCEPLAQCLSAAHHTAFVPLMPMSSSLMNGTLERGGRQAENCSASDVWGNNKGKKKDVLA